MKVKVDTSKQVWESNDKKIRIYLINEDSFEPYKTYSDEIGQGIGREFDVTTEEKQGRNGKEIFIKKPKSFGGSGFGKGDQNRDASFALAYSKDLAVAMMAAGEKPSIDDVLHTADQLLSWLKSAK